MPTPSTTNPIQIKDIRDGVIVLKDGSVRGIAQIDAINFELRSSDEQTAIIQQFQGFLNSIDFPAQVVVQSRKYSVETYLTGVQAASEQLANDLLKLQAQEYIRFVRELSELANIMSKRFYVVIALQVVTAPSESKGIFSGITGIFKKTKPSAVSSGLTDEESAAYQIQLQQRVDLILGGLSGMGLKGRALGQEDLLNLFGELYNPNA
jgi:type IV secretory pathway VirB4 component